VDYSLLWKAVIVVIGGTFLLRIAGRKSISQMTLAQVVIMIGLGSLLVQPIAGENVWSTIAVGLVLVLTLFVVEYGQIKFDFIESMITGKSKVLIEDGEINTNTLKKLRLTVDQLEMQLRQKSITNVKDVQYATLEPNGQLGFILKSDKQTATKADISMIMEEIQQLRNSLAQGTISTNQTNAGQSQGSDNLFTEVGNKAHIKSPPKYLQ
jgi:uncharacterized membrane protein YcaP (DUF421 family)